MFKLSSTAVNYWDDFESILFSTHVFQKIAVRPIKNEAKHLDFVKELINLNSLVIQELELRCDVFLCKRNLSTVTETIELDDDFGLGRAIFKLDDHLVQDVAKYCNSFGINQFINFIPTVNNGPIFPKCYSNLIYEYILINKNKINDVHSNLLNLPIIQLPLVESPNCSMSKCKSRFQIMPQFIIFQMLDVQVDDYEKVPQFIHLDRQSKKSRAVEIVINMDCNLELRLQSTLKISSFDCVDDFNYIYEDDVESVIQLTTTELISSAMNNYCVFNEADNTLMSPELLKNNTPSKYHNVSLQPLCDFTLAKLFIHSSGFGSIIPKSSLCNKILDSDDTLHELISIQKSSKQIVERSFLMLIKHQIQISFFGISTFTPASNLKHNDFCILPIENVHTQQLKSTISGIKTFLEHCFIGSCPSIQKRVTAKSYDHERKSNTNEIKYNCNSLVNEQSVKVHIDIGLTNQQSQSADISKNKVVFKDNVDKFVLEEIVDSYLHIIGMPKENTLVASAQNEHQKKEVNGDVMLKNSMSINSVYENFSSELNGYTILISEFLIESFPLILTNLTELYRINVIDCSLPYPISAIIDLNTGISIISSDAMFDLSHSNELKEFVRSLVLISFKFSTIWIVISQSNNSSHNSYQLQQFMKFFQSLSKFPDKIICRIYYDKDDSSDKVKKDEALLKYQLLCEFYARSIYDIILISTKFSLKTCALSEMKNYKTQDAFLQSLLTNNHFTSNCEFLQLFPSFNLYPSAFLLSILTLKQLCSLSLDEVLNEVKKSVNFPKIDECKFIDMITLLHVHAGLHL